MTAIFKNDITAISLEEGAQKYNVVKDQVQDAIIKMGIPPAGPPADGFRGEMPDDITQLSDVELGKLLGKLDAWCEYTSVQLALVRSDRDAAEKELDLIAAKLRTRLKFDSETGKKLTNTEREDLIKSDARYVEAQSKVLYYEGLYRYTEAIAEAAERSFKTVSRRITQRGQDLHRANRDLSPPTTIGELTKNFRKR